MSTLHHLVLIAPELDQRGEMPREKPTSARVTRGGGCLQARLAVTSRSRRTGSVMDAIRRVSRMDVCVKERGGEESLARLTDAVRVTGWTRGERKDSGWDVPGWCVFGPASLGPSGMVCSGRSVAYPRR